MATIILDKIPKNHGQDPWQDEIQDLVLPQDLIQDHSRSFPKNVCWEYSSLLSLSFPALISLSGGASDVVGAFSIGESLCMNGLQTRLL